MPQRGLSGGLPRGPFAVSLAAALVCFAAYVATMSGHLFSPDEEVQFRTTESLALRFSTAVEPIAGGFSTRRDADGNEYAQYGVGQPIAAVPFYALGAALDGAIPDDAIEGALWPTTQYHEGTPSQWKRRLGVSLFNSLVTAATVGLLCRLLLAWGVGAAGAFASSMLFGLGTYAWAHARTFFSEPLAALLLFAAFAAIDSWQRRGMEGWGRPVVAGLLAGYAFLVRKDSPLFFPGLCLFALLPCLLDATARQPFRLRRESWRRALAGGCAVGAGMVAFILVHFAIAKAQWGDAGALGYEDQAEGIQFAAPLHSGLYGFLFSYGRGLFFFSPALLLALAGWPNLWRRLPRASVGALLACLPFFLLMCRWQNWAGGWSWGPRHVYQVHVFLAIGFAGLFLPASRSAGDPSPRRRAWSWTALAAGVVCQALVHDALSPALGGGLTVAGGLLLAGGLAGLWIPEAVEDRPSSAPPAGDAARFAPSNRAIAVALALALGAGVQLYACSQSFIDYHILYFRMPDVAPSSRAQYTPGEAAGYEVVARLPGMPESAPAPLWATRVPAPIFDSLYVPHASAWHAYAAMWEAGFHDLFWLRQMGGGEMPPAAPNLEPYRAHSGVE